MLLSRFWYLILAVTAAAAVAAALLSRGIINDKLTQQVGSELRRDRVEVDLLLRLEARARIDRIGFISIDPKLGALLRQARGVGDDKQLQRLGSDAKDALRGHVARLVEAGSETADMAPDIAFALDIDGRILSQLGPLEVNPPGSSLATYPLVDRALHGYLRDDVWVYDRRVYRMAARPVLYGGEYVGAIVHGYKFDDAFVSKLVQGMGGATVAFFYGTNVLAKALPTDAPDAPQVAEVAARIAQALADERFKKGERTEPIALQAGGRAVYAPITGAAAAANVGYVVARPLHLVGSPEELFHNASQQDVQALPLPLLGGGAFALAFIGLLFMYLERDRPYKVLLRKLTEITKGERERLLVTEWRGLYRKLSDLVNQAIDKSVEKAAEMAPSSKKKANLDEILGPTPQASAEPYFGFAGDQSPSPAPKPASQPQLPAAAPPRPTPPGARPPAPSPPPRPSPAAGATSVQTSVTATGIAAPLDDEPAHFRQVYEQYIAMRQQCGESTEGLTYEKLEVTLNKTRDQVLSKHAARAVRFTVYVKEGKAALKAAPVK